MKITDMDWQDDNVIFTDRSGETIRLIDTIADSDRDSYTIKRKEDGTYNILKELAEQPKLKYRDEKEC